jgi:WD40 repeat protein
MLAATDGRNVLCWNCTTGEQLWQQKSAFGITLAFTPDGQKLIATAGNREPVWHAWDAATGKPDTELKFPEGYHYAEFVVAPDGRTLVFAQPRSVQASDHRVRLWDLRTGTPLHTLKAQGPIGPFFRDGKSFLTNDGSLQRWDLATGQPLLPDIDDVGHRSEVARAVYSSDGRRLASAANDDTILWDVAAAKPLHILRGHEATALIFTPDGKLLNSGSTSEGELHIWDSQVSEAGWQVVALHRPQSDLKYLQRFPVRRAVAAIEDQAALEQAMPAGVDVVFHTAADVSSLRRAHCATPGSRRLQTD